MYKVEMRVGVATENVRVHTWLVITTPTGEKIHRGFYPADGLNGQGKIMDDAESIHNASSGEFEITSQQFNKLNDYILNSTINPPPYSFFYGSQCTTWALNALSVSGIIDSRLAPDIGPNNLLIDFIESALFNPVWQKAGFDLFDNINDLFNNIDRSVNAPRDPLVLDLDGDGVETVGINNGILFDHDGDGIKHGTGWVKPDDGLLVVDWNGNGIIDNGKELFGDNTVLGTVNGQDHKAKDGFAALKWYDRNDADGVPQGHDGVIDQNDAIFSSLKVWQDLNQDGITQQGELKTLAELGISSICLDNKNNGSTQHGNRVDSVSSFQFSDGREHEMSSLFFAADTFRNSFTDKIPLTERTEKLPDIAGTGGLRSLREAAALDNDLATLLETFSTASTRAEQLALVDDILWQWHLGSETGSLYDRYKKFLQPDPLRNIATFSVEKASLAGRYSVIEAFNGRVVNNITYGETWGTVAPNITHIMHFFPRAVETPDFPFNAQAIDAANAIEATYQELFNQVFKSLTFQTRLEEIVNAIDLNFDNNGIKLDFSILEEKTTTNISIHKTDGISDLFDIVLHFKDLVLDGSWDFIKYYNHITSIGLIDDSIVWRSQLASFIQKTTAESTDVSLRYPQKLYR